MSPQPTAPPNTREIEFWNSTRTQSWWKHHDRIDRFMQPVTDALFEHAAPQAGEAVIDIGCGSGTTTLATAEAVGLRGVVDGFDVATLSVEGANRRLSDAGLTHARVHLADLSTAPLEANKYDLALSRFGVMFFTDPAATFTRVHAAMKPTGRLAFAVFRSPKENVWATGPLGAVRDHLDMPPPPGPEDPGQFSWADPQRVERILETAGFRNISLTPIDPLMHFAVKGGAEEAADFSLMVGPIQRGLANPSRELRDRVRSKLIDYFITIDGPHGIALPAANWIVKATALVRPRGTAARPRRIRRDRAACAAPCRASL